MSGEGEEYRCASCGGVFVKTRSDEEALAEMAADVKPHPGDDDVATICDDCWQHIMGRIAREAPWLLQESPCYELAGGSVVHIKPGCRC
jgi:hypothetical protein